MHNSKLHLLSRTALATIAASLILPSVAHAQLDEIVVTATKAEKSLQDVPLSIEAVTGEFLRDFNITDLKTLSDNIPTLTISTALTSTNVSMRGVGSGQERSFEQSVGMFIDGQYMPRSRQYISPFFDVEQVEVVKGPQAVYFGLNSTSGAIAIKTNKTEPGEGFEAFVTADAGLDIGGQGFEAGWGVSGDKVGFRVAGKFSDYDGYFTNTTLGTEEGAERSVLVRGTAVVDVTEGIRLTGKVEHSDFRSLGHVGELFDDPLSREAGDGVLNYIRSSGGTRLPTGAASGIYNEGGQPGTFIDTNNVVLTGEVDLAGGQLVATAGFSDFTYNFNLDLDTSAADGADAAINETYNQDSIDVRWSSDPSKNYQLLVGGYYQSANWFNLQPVTIGTDFLIPGAGPNALIAIITMSQPTADFLYPQGLILNQGSDNNVDSSLVSLYGAVSFDLSDRLSGSVGARWAEQEKNLSRNNLCFFTDGTGTIRTEPASVPTLDAFNLCPNIQLSGLERTRKSDNFMPEASLNYDLNDEVTVFARVGKSAKSGGFASSGSFDIANLNYGDETVWGYEAGLKSRLMGGKAEINVTAFRSDYKDLQVNSFIVGPPPTNLPVSIITNAGKVKSQGIELDGRLFVNDSITMGAAAALLDASYVDFDNAPCDRDPSDDTAGTISGCNFTGRSTPFAPNFSGNIYMNLDHNMGGDFSLIGSAKLAYSGSYFTDGTLEAAGVQDAWTKIDASIGIAHAKGWELSLIGTNVTDEAVLGSSQGFASVAGSPGALLGYLEKPRQVLVRAKWQY